MEDQFQRPTSDDAALRSQAAGESVVERVTASASERELFIKFRGITHFRVDRKEIVGFQSWERNRGRDDAIFEIEFYIRTGPPITLDYDNRDRWIAVLNALDGCKYLPQWSLEDNR